MEQELTTIISKELQNLTPGHSNYLQKVNKNLPLLQDNQIIKLKYASKTFAKMSVDEITMSAYDLLLKIHVIVGWTIPVSEFMDILTDQFSKKLTEKYANVNADEIEYAFRNRGFDAKDWGKAMNLTMIDEIIAPYLEVRFDLSRTEESFAHKNFIEEDFEKELTDEEWNDWLKDMLTYDINLLPCAAYEYLVKKELISLTSTEKHDYLSRAKDKMINHLEAGSKEMLEFLKMKEKDNYSAAVKASLITISKRLAISDYLQKTFSTQQ